MLPVFLEKTYFCVLKIMNLGSTTPNLHKLWHQNVCVQKWSYAFQGKRLRALAYYLDGKVFTIY